MDMADIHCYCDIGSSTLFHSSAQEMIHIHHIMFYGKIRKATANAITPELALCH